MRIQVRYHLSVRLSLKLRTEDYEVHEGGTLGELVVMVVAKHGAKFGDPSQYSFAIGGRHADSSQPLGDGDVVSIYPPVAGGGTRGKPEYW